MAKIISIISGKGGSGKTAVCVNLASSLKLLCKKTLVIDCSFGIRNDDIPLARSEHLLYNINDVITESVDPEDAIIKGETDYLPDFIGASLDSIPEHFSPRFERFIKKISHKYDYIVVDTPSSTGPEFECALRCADIVIAVSPTDSLSVSNTALCLRRADDSKEKYLVINKVDYSSDEFIPEDIADEIGARIIGIIPYDEYMTKSLEGGDPISRYATFAGNETENIALRICGIYIPPQSSSVLGRRRDKNKLVLKKTSGRV